MVDYSGSGRILQLVSCSYRNSEVKREEGNNGNVSQTEGAYFLRLLQIFWIQFKLFEGISINQ